MRWQVVALRVQEQFQSSLQQHLPSQVTPSSSPAKRQDPISTHMLAALEGAESSAFSSTCWKQAERH